MRATNPPSRLGRWGTRRAWMQWIAALIVLTAIVDSGSRWLDLASVALWAVAMVIGSLILLWRTWAHRAKGRVFLGQLSAMPRSWRHWVLGDD